jgi:putative aminopeptidase FrvX
MNVNGSFIDVLKALIRHPSVVGAEHAFFRVLQRELEERGAIVDWYEGVLVARGFSPQSALFSAHIDRHGLVCTGPNEFQYAAFVTGNRGDLPGDSVSRRMMTKITNRFATMDVMAYEPWSGVYLGRGTITQAMVCEHRNNLVFRIDGLEHLVAGTPIAFADRLRIEDGYYLGQLDNVLAAALLVHLFDLGFQGTAFFTAQEEAGRSWRFLMEWFQRFGGSTRNLIVLDTSPFTDRTTADRQDIVLRRRDNYAAFDEPLTDAVATHCEALGIRTLYKDAYIEQLNKQAEAEGRDTHSIGTTELGRLIDATGGSITGTTIQIPTTNYHTMHETASRAACDKALHLLCRVAGIEYQSAVGS